MLSFSAVVSAISLNTLYLPIFVLARKMEQHTGAALKSISNRKGA